MSMLARYRKSGGVAELVKLIESSSEPKRSNLLNMVRSEDPIFAAEVEARIINFTKFKVLSEAIVAEVLSTTAPKFLAIALHGDTSDFVKLAEKCLGKNFSQYKSELEDLASKPPTPAQIESAQNKIISEARKAEGAGRVRLPVAVVSPAQLADAHAGIAGTPASASASASGPGGEEMPGIESFKLDPPPEGLVGATLDMFLKTALGK